jgi:hypothetical protein
LLFEQQQQRDLPSLGSMLPLLLPPPLPWLLPLSLMTSPAPEQVLSAQHGFLFLSQPLSPAAPDLMERKGMRELCARSDQQGWLLIQHLPRTPTLLQ